MSVSENLQMAKEAIYYVNNRNITSINVPFRIKSYHKSPLSRFDMFLFCYMRSEVDVSDDTFYHHYHALASRQEEHLARPITQEEANALGKLVEDQLNLNRSMIPKINDILESTKTTSEKKKLLKELMESSNFNPDQFYVLWERTTTDKPDEARIRSNIRAIQFRHGNCGEKSAVAATWRSTNQGDERDFLGCR